MKKMSRREKCWSFFAQILLKLHFEWKIQAKDGHNQSLFFQIRALFSIFQKGQVRPPPFPRSCAPFIYFINKFENCLKQVVYINTLNSPQSFFSLTSETLIWQPKPNLVTATQILRPKLNSTNACLVSLGQEREDAQIFAYLNNKHVF